MYLGLSVVAVVPTNTLTQHDAWLPPRKTLTLQPLYILHDLHKGDSSAASPSHFRPPKEYTNNILYIFYVYYFFFQDWLGDKKKEESVDALKYLL